MRASGSSTATGRAQARSSENTSTETWDGIRQGMDACFFEKSMKRADWMEIQTQVYNLAVDVTVNEPPGLSHRRPNKSSKSHKPEQHVNRKCAEVYEKVKKYFESYLEKLSEECKKHPEEDMLVFYKKKWELYVKAALTVDGLFEYVNRTYVQRQRDQNSNQGSFNINELALVSWRDTFYCSLKDRITRALFQLIRRDRNGEQINTNLVSNVIHSLVRLSIQNPWDSNRSLPSHGTPSSANTFQGPRVSPISTVYMSGVSNNRRDTLSSSQNSIFFYKENFEDDFIVETEEFYRNESAQFIREHSFTEYMTKAETRLDEEKFRVSLYLHNDTERRLIQACEKVLIEDHIDRYYQEYLILLRDHKTEDLARIYKLCSRIHDTLEKLQDKFQEHVIARGMEAMERVLEEMEKSKTTSGKSELPKMYAEAIISVHKQFLQLINVAFANNAGFLTALDLANEQYINRNPVTVQPLPNQPPTQKTDPAKSSAELLALYFDSLLRVSSRKADDNDLEEHLQDSMLIFKFITEKDVFSRHFSRQLATRLVGGISVSDDAEQSMIEKLKSTCGFEYTNKFQKMFTDVNLSKKLSEDFRKTAALDFDFSIIVGTSASWPFNPIKGYILSKEFQPTFDKFKLFYNQKFSNRKLEWQWNKCKGEIAANCFPKTYVFVATLYQMGVLLLFNKSATLSMAHIIQECGIPNKESSIQVVQQLVRLKILNNNGSDETDENTEITVSESYHNKKVKVPIGMPLKAEQRQDRVHTDRQVEEDRKNVIQAAIVRIMKMRKRLNHNQLIQEAIDQVKSRFQPTIASIKKEIDTLIEKDFLRRAEDQRNMYEYVA